MPSSLHNFFFAALTFSHINIFLQISVPIRERYPSASVVLTFHLRKASLGLAELLSPFCFDRSLGKSCRSQKNNLSGTVVRQQNPSTTLTLLPRPVKFLSIFLAFSPQQRWSPCVVWCPPLDVYHLLYLKDLSETRVEMHQYNLPKRSILLARIQGNLQWCRK